LLGECKGRKPVIRPRQRWEDDIKIDLQEISLEGVDWVE
jgi:hypothetical protein